MTGADPGYPDDLRLVLRADGLTWRTSAHGQLTVRDERHRRRGLRMNRSAGVLWERLAGGSSVSDLGAVLTARFGVDPARARADVADFLAELSRRGLVAPADPV